MTKEEIEQQEALLKNRYGDLLSEVEKIMFRHDTEGLGEISGLDDEYSPEARHVLLRLDSVKTVEDFRALVRCVYVEMFGEELFSSPEKLQALADELWGYMASRGVLDDIGRT